MTRGLEFKVDRAAPGVVFLRLKGEFEGMAAIEAKEKLLACAVDSEGGDLVLDFGEIGYRR